MKLKFYPAWVTLISTLCVCPLFSNLALKTIATEDGNISPRGEPGTRVVAFLAFVPLRRGLRCLPCFSDGVTHTHSKTRARNHAIPVSVGSEITIDRVESSDGRERGNRLTVSSLRVSRESNDIIGVGARMSCALKYLDKLITSRIYFLTESPRREGHLTEFSVSDFWKIHAKRNCEAFQNCALGFRLVLEGRNWFSVECFPDFWELDDDTFIFLNMY